MKIVKIALLLLTLSSCDFSTKRSEIVTGFLLLSPSRSDSSFDLFLPANIDTLNTLKENLQKIEKNTAYRITPGRNLAFSKEAVRLRNEAVDKSYAEDFKYCLVLPIKAKYDNDAEERYKDLEKNKRLNMPYTFYRRTQVEYYNTKQAYLKNIEILKLPRD